MIMGPSINQREKSLILPKSAILAPITPTLQPGQSVSQTSLISITSAAFINNSHLTPILTAPRIWLDSWSPSSNMLAYRTFTAEELKNDFKLPPGTLHFLNLNTNQTCAYPYGVGYFRSFVWLAMGQILSATDTRASPPNQVVILSNPCANRVTNLTMLFPDRVSTIISAKSDHSTFVVGGERTQWLYTPQAHAVRPLATSLQNLGAAVAWSPLGNYLTATMLRFKDQMTLATTYAINLNTGQIESTVQWQAHLYEGNEFLTPLWLNERQFLIPETMDQGPLLITVGQKPVPIAPKWFGVSPHRFQWANAALIANSQHYHLVFSTPTTDEEPYTYLPLRLYHSETGKVDELPFQHLISTPGSEPFQHMLGFSPDGRWLLGFNDSPSNVWLWPVDGSSGQGIQLPIHGASSPMVWKPDSTQLAVGGYGGVILFAVPGGAQVGFVKISDYNAEPFGWSPDGKFLAIRGVGYGQEALFIRQTQSPQSKQ